MSVRRGIVLALWLLLCGMPGRAAGFTISDAKLLADESSVSLTGKVVTYAAADFFYLEEDSRFAGIRVAKPSHGLDVGMRVDVAGTMQTNSNKERYIAAVLAGRTNAFNMSDVILPIGLTNAALGGSNWFLSSAGGQAGSKLNGLNNIGLLVRTWGRFLPTDSVRFTVDDGSGPVVCIAPEGTFICPEWRYVAVTGVSSVVVDGAEAKSAVLAREIDVLSSESLCNPTLPAGEQSPVVANVYTYTTGGAVCSDGHQVEYCFNWGDGQSSPWSTSTSASYSWRTRGSRNVSVTARCQVNPSISATSTSLPVVVTEDVTAPGKPIGDQAPKMNISCIYSASPSVCSAGHPVEYSFDWGDGTSSPWTTSTSESHAWSSFGNVSAVVKARCQVNKDVVSSSEPLPVSVVNTMYIIHDNDFAEDGDGFLAYIWLHHAQDLGLCKVLAAVAGQDDHLREVPGPYGDTISAQLDYVRSWYGHDDIPIGLPYADGQDSYRTLRRTLPPIPSSCSAPYAQSQDSDEVYGNILASMPDHSVTILSTGQLVALSRFMHSTGRWGGKTAMELLSSKVCLLALGSGVYPPSNRITDINTTNFGCPWNSSYSEPLRTEIRNACKDASIYVLSHWPSDVQITYYGESINMGKVVHDPSLLLGSHPTSIKPYTHDSSTRLCEAHDIIRAMLLIKGLGGMHMLSASGFCTVYPDGSQDWTADAVDGVPTAGRPIARYVMAAVSEYDENVWGSYLIRMLPQPPKRDHGLVIGYDFAGGEYGSQLPSTANAVADVAGNLPLTAYGTTRPKYLRDGIITFPVGSYLEKLIGNSLGFGVLNNSDKQWYGVIDVYMPNATVTDTLVFAGASHSGSNNTENWSIGISNKKWRFHRRKADGSIEDEVLSADDITVGWHRICFANRLVSTGTRQVMTLYVDGVKQGEVTARVQSDTCGYFRINGGSWPGAVAANYPIAMFRLYNRRPISASELTAEWMDTKRR